MTEKERNELLSVCRQAAAIAQAHDVLLCMECHKKTFTENPGDSIWLMESVNSPHFRMYWQPFQWQDAEQNVKNAQAIAPWVEHIHVFQWNENEKFPLRSGVEDWKAYLKAFSTPHTLLLEFMPNGTIDELAGEASTLKMIVGESE